jgi:hypothetical protein
MTGGEQQAVALAQRHLELIGEVDDHLRARTRASGLQEAQVAGRDARLEREVELGHPPALSPLAKQCTGIRRIQHPTHRVRAYRPSGPPSLTSEVMTGRQIRSVH